MIPPLSMPQWPGARRSVWPLRGTETTGPAAPTAAAAAGAGPGSPGPGSNQPEHGSGAGPCGRGQCAGPAGGLSGSRRPLCDAKSDRDCPPPTSGPHAAIAVTGSGLILIFLI